MPQDSGTMFWRSDDFGETAMQSTDPYVRMDPHGVMRVGETRVMLDSVVAAFEQGHSPETIQQEYRP